MASASITSAQIAPVNPGAGLVAFNELIRHRTDGTPIPAHHLRSVCALMRMIPGATNRRTPPNKRLLAEAVKLLQKAPQPIPSAWSKPTLADAVAAWAEAALNLASPQMQHNLFLSLSQSPRLTQVAIPSVALDQIPASSTSSASATQPTPALTPIPPSQPPATQHRTISALTPPQGTPVQINTGTPVQNATHGTSQRSPTATSPENRLAATTPDTSTQHQTGPDPAFALRVGACRSASSPAQQTTATNDVSACNGKRATNRYPQYSIKSSAQLQTN